MNEDPLHSSLGRLNESPSEKEGKSGQPRPHGVAVKSLNESPSEKEGKWSVSPGGTFTGYASMKVPPKRKGNSICLRFPCLW